MTNLIPDPNPLGSLAQSIATATARHAMTAAAGVLVAKGLVNSAQSAQLVDIGSGLILAVVALGWSWAQKRLAHRVITGNA